MLTDGIKCGRWQRIPVSTLAIEKYTFNSRKKPFGQEGQRKRNKTFVSDIINNTDVFTYLPLVIILFKLKRSERE
jgi:hypothetical protein